MVGLLCFKTNFEAAHEKTAVTTSILAITFYLYLSNDNEWLSCDT